MAKAKRATKAAAVATAVHVGNNDDAVYGEFLERFQARFKGAIGGGKEPLLTTDADPTAMWEAYLCALPGSERQYHNCSACRHMIYRYGGLVTVDDKGRSTPALWHEDVAPNELSDSIAALAKLVRKAKVNGVFLSARSVLGDALTGAWIHLSATLPATMVYRGKTKTDRQAMAEKREDHGQVARALAEFSGDHLETAVRILQSDALYRSEKVLEPAEWLLARHVERETAKGKDARENLLWRAIATAPAGFCHPRTSMIGTLLEDIVAGKDFDACARAFAEKMDPTRYRRSTADPKAGQIAAAEKAVEALGVIPAFDRRYAVAADFDVPGAVVWSPGDTKKAAKVKPPKAGVFDHLKPGAKAGATPDIPAKLMTWEKFSRDILPGVAVLHYRVPVIGPFCALTAPADMEAPGILQWSNGVSWCFPAQAARADEWSLRPGADARVRMIINPPNLWDDPAKNAQHGKGVFVLIEGAKDKRGLPGGGLFTEHLRGDLLPYRSTIEAHVNQLVVAGADDPGTVGFGIGLMAGGKWTEMAAPRATTKNAAGAAPKRVHVILVVDDSGSMASYIYAARSAMASLLASVRAMPGQVDVTVTLFGTSARTFCERQPVSAVGGIEDAMNGSSGNTALNDTLAESIQRGLAWPDASQADTSFFLGIVTDGEENASHRYDVNTVRALVQAATATGRWTIAFAGAGSNPLGYGRAIGIPEGNMTSFHASAEGFRDIGDRYSSSSAALARSYSGGARASTSFFAAANSRQPVGSDHPVFVATMRDGSNAAFTIDRWE